MGKRKRGREREAKRRGVADVSAMTIKKRIRRR